VGDIVTHPFSGSNPFFFWNSMSGFEEFSWQTSLATLALTTETVLLLVLLLPLPPVLALPLSQLLKQLFRQQGVITWAVIITLMAAESSYRMYWYSSRECPADYEARLSFTIASSRAQKNFYLNMFTFALMLIIFRCRQMVSNIAKLKEELAKERTKSLSKQQ